MNILTYLHLQRESRLSVLLVELNYHFLTCSQANKTGAVASPRCRSVAVGFPISPSLAIKSRISSTTYNASEDHKIILLNLQLASFSF